MAWIVLIIFVAAVAAIFGFAPFRRTLVSAPLLAAYRRILPPMSQTEQEAIDAGTVWWDGELFSGRPDWSKLAAYPQPVLTPEEQAFVGEIFRVRHFQALVGNTQRLTGLPVADPFVIAAARIRGGCVVTEEVKKPNAAKVPNVCEHFGIECLNVEGFLEQNGWEF